MNKIVEIFRAWKIAYNPNETQSKLAAERLSICNECEHKKETPYIHCGACGCALKAKIFTPIIGGCPHNKWIAVEMKYENDKNLNNYNNLKK